MADASFTFTRDLVAGSPADLVITSDPTADYCIQSFGRPGRIPVNTMASSGLTHGAVVIRSRLEEATIPLAFYVQGDTTSEVESRVDAVEACLTQFYFSVTCDIDGVARGYSCDPSAVSSEGVIEGWVRNYIAQLSVVLSVYPLAAS